MRCFKTLILCAFFLTTRYAAAHPHVWILIEVQPRLNAAGEITALQQRWVFDPMYSLIFIEEMNRLPAAEQAHYWHKVEDLILKPLFAETFYTHPKNAFGEAQNARLYPSQDELIIEAELPLLKPTKSLYYQVYEPSYYVEILHHPEQQRLFGACTLSVSDEKPAGIREEAAADSALIYDIGQYFAEHAEVVCR